ncbi:hypothetical protein ASE66_12565 [Bosea sp. Root483D1]|nr:hypothetical protein ASE66_12565 [Bosea sp. Root483D1]
MSYALMALSGLITFFALGYALNAGYTALMFRYGSILASLSIAGGLLLAAAGCLLAARIVGDRPRAAPAPLNLQYEAYMLRRTKWPALAAGAGIAGVAAVAAAVVRRHKRALSGKRDNNTH